MRTSMTTIAAAGMDIATGFNILLAALVHALQLLVLHVEKEPLTKFSQLDLTPSHCPPKDAHAPRPKAVPDAVHVAQVSAKVPLKSVDLQVNGRELESLTLHLMSAEMRPQRTTKRMMAQQKVLTDIGGLKKVLEIEVL
jgi:hypothetical protein